MGKSEKEFGKDLIKFYKEFIKGNSSAIKTLADIQDKYPEEYKLLEDLREDPTIVEKLSDKLTEEERNAIIIVLIRAAQLGRKTQNMFELSSEDKRKLAKELENFGEFVEKKMNELTEKRENGE